MEKLLLTFGKWLALKPPMFSTFLIMTQTKTGASHFKGSLFKSAATSALALSAVVGGVILSGGEAKALRCNFDAGSLTNCNYGVYYDTNPRATDKQIKFISGPTGGSGNIEWQWVDINGNNEWRIPPDPNSMDVWNVDVDFNPPFLGNNPPLNPSVLKYIIQITEPEYYFHDVSLGADFLLGTGVSTVTKDIYTAIGHDPGDLLTTLTCTGAADGSTICDGAFVVPDHLQKLYIVDTATYGGRPIDNYTNSFRQQRKKVPAPLPILGAAAAFSSIRQARKFSSHLKTFSMG